jgi:hypothetical protein
VSSSLTSWLCGGKKPSVGSVCLRIVMSRACRPPSAGDASRALNTSLRPASVAMHSSDSPIMPSRSSSSCLCSSSTPVARVLARWCARSATVKYCRRLHVLFCWLPKAAFGTNSDSPRSPHMSRLYRRIASIVSCEAWSSANGRCLNHPSICVTTPPDR